MDSLYPPTWQVKIWTVRITALYVVSKQEDKSKRTVYAAIKRRNATVIFRDWGCRRQGSNLRHITNRVAIVLE